MGWSKEVKAEVLVSCGRHCCICHKFRGLKIELHHIVLKSEGGEETVENCIPLCFDCHADQSSYDYKHPRGTKYSREELKGHRDKWYSLVNQNLGTGTIEHLEQDKALILDIYKIIPAESFIRYFQKVDFDKEKFHFNKFENFDELVYFQNLEPWIVFFDTDIQTIYIELLSAINIFSEMISIDIFNIVEDLISEERIGESFIGDINEDTSVEKLAKRIVDCYTEFVSLARMKLGVIIPVYQD